MEDSSGKNNGLSDSGDVPVDVEVEIQGENGNLTQKENNVVHSINVEGIVFSAAIYCLLFFDLASIHVFLRRVLAFSA